MEEIYSNEQQDKQQESFQLGGIESGEDHTNSKLSFQDNRPEAIAQRKMQEGIKNSNNSIQLQTEDNSEQQTPELSGGKVNNTGLPDDLKAGIEKLSGLRMDDVKVHYNSAKPKQLNALAYAQGTDIHIGPGQEQHLAHEAWHVVQQKEGRVAQTMQLKGGVAVNDDDGLEKEADVMGSKALNVKNNQNLGQDLIDKGPSGTTDVSQLARNYTKKQKKEKDEILRIVESMELLGLPTPSTAEEDDYIWHHIMPFSTLEEAENSQNFENNRGDMELGPHNQRLFDPGGHFDPNYRTREGGGAKYDATTAKVFSTNSATENDDSIQPNLSLNHLGKIVTAGQVGYSQHGTSEANATNYLGVAESWAQWYLPADYAGLLSIAKIKPALNSTGITASDDNAGKVQNILKELHASYKTHHQKTVDGYKFKKDAVEVNGIPLLKLSKKTPELNKKIENKEIYLVVDKLLKTAKKYLLRGSVSKEARSPAEEWKYKLTVAMDEMLKEGLTGDLFGGVNIPLTYLKKLCLDIVKDKVDRTTEPFEYPEDNKATIYNYLEAINPFLDVGELKDGLEAIMVESLEGVEVREENFDPEAEVLEDPAVEELLGKVLGNNLNKEEHDIDLADVKNLAYTILCAELDPDDYQYCSPSDLADMFRNQKQKELNDWAASKNIARNKIPEGLSSFVNKYKNDLNAWFYKITDFIHNGADEEVTASEDEITTLAGRYANRYTKNGKKDTMASLYKVPYKELGVRFSSYLQGSQYKDIALPAHSENENTRKERETTWKKDVLTWIKAKLGTDPKEDKFLPNHIYPVYLRDEEKE